MQRLSLISLMIIFGVFQAAFAQNTAIVTMVERLLSHENAGHHCFHHTPMLCEVLIKNNTLHLYLETEQTAVNEDLYDHLLESLLPIMEQHDLHTNMQVYIKTPTSWAYQNWAEAFPSTPIPVYKKSHAEPHIPAIQTNQERNLSNPHLGQTLSNGSLSGKTVWLSPGHGWKADNSSNNWLTQRGNTNDYVEDFGTVEGVDYYLQQYLMNAGANVWVVRERDVNTNEVIVDNDAGAPTYTTTGNWTTSSSTGYAGGTYQFATSVGSESATAVYTPDIPESGWYWVSVFYREGTNRSPDVRYKVNHAGGQTIVSLNQEVHGLTWNYIGQFYFEAGTQGSVVLSNESAEGGQAIIADAVRFGGGMGTEGDCTYGGGPSGRPRFEEAARQYALFQGYPTCTGDVTIRPKYAEWELAKGTTTEQNNAIYVSWHTNAFNGTARGTVTYTFNGANGIPITPGSVDLAGFIQNEIVNDIWGAWDSNWNDRGLNEANFGELRELTTMPGCLIELAFHDNPDDAAALKTPQFRNLSARAIYQGIVKFFNDRDGSPLTLLPEPPTHLLAQNANEGEITLRWKAPNYGDGVAGDAATGYKVYLSTHGKGFQDGIVVTDTSYTFTGLQAGQTYYFQVTATNAGGESFPTATVAARTPDVGSFAALTTPTYLLVDGFDRIDRFGAVAQYESAALGTVDRMFLERMNRYDYMVEHAQGFEYCNIAFDGASNEAVIAGMVSLDNYDGIDWIAGEESTVDRSLDATEQSLLMNYLDGGGNLLISGAEIGWDIGRSASPNASLTFFNDYLKSQYIGDDGATYDFAAIGGSIFDGINGSFDDGSNGYYNVEYPDRLAPLGGASVVLNYSGGTADGAAIAYKGTDFGVVHIGFPLEAVTDASTRNNLICEAIHHLTPYTCIPNQTITATIGDTTTIFAGNNIDASCIIQSGANAVFSGGNEVNLHPDFEVELGATFLGTIGGCVE